MRAPEVIRVRNVSLIVQLTCVRVKVFSFKRCIVPVHNLDDALSSVLTEQVLGGRILLTLVVLIQVTRTLICLGVFAPLRLVLLAFLALRLREADSNEEAGAVDELEAELYDLSGRRNLERLLLRCFD